MLVFIYSLLFSEPAHSTAGSSRFTEIWEAYFNYPGFEAWKFLNLFIFAGLAVYVIRKPLSDVFKAKREAIRADLIRAEEEKQAALRKLTETEAKLARLDSDISAIRERAASEAAAEKSRIAEQTQTEIQKLREQAANEIAQAGKHAKVELRKFSAEESIRLAESLIKEKINDAADSRIVKSGIESIGGLK